MKWPTTGKESYSTSSTSCRGSGAHYPNKTFFVLLQKLGVAAFKVTQFEVRSFPFLLLYSNIIWQQMFPKELIPPTITQKSLPNAKGVQIHGAGSLCTRRQACRSRRCKALQGPPALLNLLSPPRGGCFPAPLGPAVVEGAGGCAEDERDGGR